MNETSVILSRVALSSTAVHVLLSLLLQSQPLLINGVLVLVVFSAFVVFSLFVGRPLWELPSVLSSLLYDGSPPRLWLLLFWLFCVLVSLLFGAIVTRSGRSSTLHRKFFHITVSLIFLSGLLVDRPFLALAGSLSLCIFIILETLRFFSVPPWSGSLDEYLLVFRDEQDSFGILLTPILLLGGVFLPVFLPFSPSQRATISDTAGLVSVGIGDAAAAVCGSLLGSHHWPRSRKTLEGSTAMFLSQLSAYFLLLFFWTHQSPIYYVRVVFTSIVATILEASLPRFDNLCVPLVSWLLLL